MGTVTDQEWAALKTVFERDKLNWPGMHSCPNCGYCPHCGRSNHTPSPYWPPYISPYVSPYTWTRTTTATGTQTSSGLLNNQPITGSSTNKL
jgi:hypothetical protein